MDDLDLEDGKAGRILLGGDFLCSSESNLNLKFDVWLRVMSEVVPKLLNLLFGVYNWENCATSLRFRGVLIGIFLDIFETF
jgi:hypothetical protein